MYHIVLPNSSDIEEPEQKIISFDTYDEALEWAQDMLHTDDEGRLCIIRDENSNDGELNEEETEF